MSGIKTGSPLLAINIPIYNRSVFLDKMLSSFLADQDLFEDKVSLFISDNCSSEPLADIVERYREKGLCVRYSRNESNIGGDGNIRRCFRQMGGKYVWALGSDDIPAPGVLRRIIGILENGDYGLLHLDNHSGNNGFTEFDSADDFFLKVHVWMTFISGNIVAARFIQDIPLEQYEQTSLQQIPLFLAAGYGSERNAILSCDYLSPDSDASNNGGYNLFKVFCDNFLSMLESAVNAGTMSPKTFREIKRVTFRDFLAENFIIPLLILRKDSGFNVAGAWGMVFRHYGSCPYSYYYLARKLAGAFVNKFFRRSK